MARLANYFGKFPQYFLLLNVKFCSPLKQSLHNRDDYKHAYINCRPLLERVHPEWKDDKVFFDYIKACGKEAKEYKSCVNWYACYAQKPLT